MSGQANARQLVTVTGKTVEKLEYQGQAVVTFSMVDELHGNKNRDARKRFAANRKQFEEGVDVMAIESGQARSMGLHAPNGITLLTESGYLKLVKTFTDDLAWQVQGQLVECYFHVKQIQAPILPVVQDPKTQALIHLLTKTDVLEQQQAVLANQQQVITTGLAETRHDLNRFIEERRLENWQQANILKAVNHKVELWREMYPAINVKKAYPAIWRHIKEKFNVPRYNEIPSKEYDRAMSLITKLNISNLAGL